MNESIYLLRSNPALSTNIKLVVDTQYNLYFESYSASPELSDQKYKKFQINSTSFLSERMAFFYTDMPADTAFSVKNDIKSDTIQNDYSMQYDDIYYSGARAVEDVRYAEEFQYNTTLKIDASTLPKWFFIFRVDGAGDVGVTQTFNVYPSVLNPLEPNGVDTVLFNFKVVQVYDLSSNTDLGQLFQKNYIDDEVLPKSCFELNLKDYEFSTWNGYDYNFGGVVSKSFFLNEYMQNQTTHFELESFITDGFKKNEVIAANYLNVSYLFTDTVSDILFPGTTYNINQYKFINDYITQGIIKQTDIATGPNSLGEITFNNNIPYSKKWTINRYSGFYIKNLNKFDKLSPVIPAQLKNDPTINIVNNNFMIGSTPVDPTTGGWNANHLYYVKINKDYYLIEKTDAGNYTLVSNSTTNTIINMNIIDVINNQQKNQPVKIEYHINSTDGMYYPYIVNNDNTFYFNACTFFYQLVIIKIFDEFYTCKVDNTGRMFLFTDENITCNSITFNRQLGINPIETIGVNPLTKDATISYFELYIPEFTEIADWDFSRTKTDYTKIEYDTTNSINFDRPFIHNTNIQDTAVPHNELIESGYNVNVNQEVYDSINNVWSTAVGNTPDVLDGTATFILPSTSEYAVGGDLYVLDNTKSLSRIWDLNQSMVKWGYMNSINNGAYLYKLNNSLDISGVWNLTPSIYDANINIHSMNLDWFYTPGIPLHITLSTNIAPTFYTNDKYCIHRSLNIDLLDNNIFNFSNFTGTSLNDKYKINLDYYKNPNCIIDYFTFILDQPTALNISQNDYVTYPPVADKFNVTQIDKIAYFNMSDKVNGPDVFFRGFNAYLQYVNLSNPNVLSTYTITPADDISGYGFAILFDNIETNDTTKWGLAGIEIIMNKWYENILIYIYIYTPYGSITNFHYAKRDNLYNQTTVQYALTDTITGATSWVNSELPIQALTLSNFVKIITDNNFSPINFSDGLKYTVLDDIQTWNLYSSVPASIATTDSIIIYYTSATNITTVTLTANSYLPFKHSDWFYINNSGTLLDGQNYQIVDKIGINKITFNIMGNIFNVGAGLYDINITDLLLLSLPVPIASTNTDTLTISGELSVLPFRFALIEPDIVFVDRTVNIVSGDTSCPVLPQNNVKNDANLLMQTVNTAAASNTNYNDGIIPYVYNNDIISRNINHLVKPDLTYTEINNLPSIYRYSGSYEPILREINIFAKTPNLSIFEDPILFLSTVINSNNKFNIVVVINTGFLNFIDLTNNLIYFNSYSNSANPGFVTFPELARQTAHILSFVYDPISGNTTIVTSLEVDVNLYPVPIDFTETSPINYTLDEFNIILIQTFQKNTFFNINHFDFGIVKDVMISKVYENVNPLKTSMDVYNTSNKYPMIDEVGITEIDRFIFKSNWDRIYYYKTDTNKYNLV